jgi:hypothetical protein
MLFAAVHESAFGTQQKFADVRYSVAIEGKADIQRTAVPGIGWCWTTG